MSSIKFLLIFLGICALCAGGAVYVEEMNPLTTILVPKYWVVFGFISVLTIIAYFLSLFGLQRDPEASVLIIMGSVVLKLVFSMVFVLTYLLKFKVNDVYFCLQFFSLYFLFTTFEVYALVCNLRHQNKT